MDYFVDHLPNFFLSALWGSFTGAVAYGICRGLEVLLRWIGLLGFAAWALVFLNFSPRNEVPHFPVSFLVFGLSLFGAWVHVRSGGKSANGYCAIGLALLSISLNFLFWFLPIMMGPYSFPQGLSFANLELFGLIGTVVYPVATPLAIWIWRSSRIRVGVDVPFED